ncbi:hypothetical protein ARMSODRAFT_974057 [Armillaria solidipes]|uniref:Uncharacterized protein n=1 Tax=Armillaria solidipes TaxID=1076256 RepID=A0A2H3C1S8_9AGAR|nr:hypothetical protein ARMSODRAFT_974057 [Armillaria solidipes]
MVRLEELTPANIRTNPQLLLHQSAPEKPRQFNDSFRGAVLLNSDFFLVSPNCGVLRAPPLGVNREVYMRRDYLYGDDDPLCWPQLYCPEYPHLACIRTPPANMSPSDLFFPLFAPVTRVLFSPCAEYSIVPNIGKLARTYLEKLRAACVDIMKTARRIDKPGTLRAQIELDCNMIDLFLTRLQALPMTYERVYLTVRETQRVTRLLRACIDYMQIYKPRMDGSAEKDPKICDPMIMGAFVEDATTLQNFFRAKIPVWTMRPLKEAALYRIDVLTEIETPENWLVLDPSRLKLRSVYTGAPNQSKYAAMSLFTRDHLRWSNPFRLSSAVIMTRQNPPPPATTSAVDVRFSPYNNRTRSGRAKIPKSSSNVSGFTDPLHELLPPIVPVWREALLQVDVDITRCHSSAKVVGINGLSFPRPDLFASIENTDKRDVAFRTWLRLRSAMLARLSVLDYVPPTLLHQEWRALLTLPYLWELGNKDTKSAQVREKVKRLMSGCCEEFEGDINIDELRGTWRDKEFGTLTENGKREILWEVAEMGFRLEVHALDQRASVANIKDEAHSRDLGRCFPHGLTHPACVDLGSANFGLAHPSWLERAPYLFSLRKVMRSWKGDQPSFVTAINPDGYTELAYLELEKKVAAYYADTFFLYFGRAPTLPRQLQHAPEVSYIPEVRERVSMVQQGKYKDISEWEK